MKPNPPRHNIKKRRTTVTLPAESLAQATRIARAKNVNLSTVVSEALSEGLRVQAAIDRSEEILEAYRTAFSGFSAVETALLDGIVLERAPRR